jgi:hypothetical protein
VIAPVLAEPLAFAAVMANSREEIMASPHGYARFAVVVYTANRPGLPLRPTLNYFEWNSVDAKAPHGVIEQDMGSGYHRHEVTAYACKLFPVVTRDAALTGTA